MKFVFKLLLCFNLISFAYNVFAIPPSDYEFHNFNEGVKLSKVENKPLFLLFGFEKCPACYMLYNKAFKDSKLKEYLKNNFILVYVSTLGENEPNIYELPNGSLFTNKQLTKYYKIETVSAWIWMNPQGNILDSDKGGDTTPREFFVHGEKVLSKFHSNR